jgi:hypothetical protein
VPMCCKIISKNFFVEILSIGLILWIVVKSIYYP